VTSTPRFRDVATAAPAAVFFSWFVTRRS
jgi:hypothetical protein